MKKNLNAWKRTISSIAAVAVVMSLGGPMLPVYGVEYPTAPPTSQGEAQPETGTNTQTTDWEKTALDAIGTAAGKDAVEKIYNHLRTLTDHKDAQSFQTLAAKVDSKLECKTISGTLSSADHKWNVVKLDNAWYAVDVEKDVLLAGSKTALAGNKTFGSAYVSSEAEPKTVLSEDSYKITITITPAAGTKVYGDSDPVFTYSASDKTITLGGNISRTSGDDVGEYAYTLGDLKVSDANKAGQYKLVLAANAPKFKVTARPLTIKEIILQGDSKTANGDANVPFSQIALDNVVNQDDVSVDLTKITAVVSSADAGVYKDITVSGITLQGAKAKNYSIESTAKVEKTFEIKSPEPPAVENNEGEKDGTATPPENSGSETTDSNGTGTSQTPSDSNTTSTTTNLNRTRACGENAR